LAKITADKETATVYLPHYIRKEGLTQLKEKERMKLMLLLFFDSRMELMPSISSLRVSGSPNRKPTLMCMLNIHLIDHLRLFLTNTTNLEYKGNQKRSTFEKKKKSLKNKPCSSKKMFQGQ
jgi:hypothetical protein